MPQGDLDFEERAISAYQRAIEAVRECRTAYENAGLLVPDRICRFLSPATAASATDSKPRLVVPPPTRPLQPASARADWLWLPYESVTPKTAALAALRDAGAPVAPSALRDRINALRPNKPVSKGVLANIGTRLFGSVISRDGDGWSLLNPEQAPTLYEGIVWGPKEAFEAQDLAEHRRLCVVHVIGTTPLQIMQILQVLDGCGWVHAPLSKDLLKTDLQTLDGEGRARRIGNSGKWEAVK